MIETKNQQKRTVVELDSTEDRWLLASIVAKNIANWETNEH